MIGPSAIAAGEVAIIREGRTAWMRLRRYASYDWLGVARALAIGDLAIGGWLTERVLADIAGHGRSSALRVLDWRDDVEGRRAGLDDAKRRRVNHPNLAHERHTKGLAITEQRNVARRMPKGAKRKSPAFLGEMIERVATTLREARHCGGHIVVTTAAPRATFRAVDELAGSLDASLVGLLFGPRGLAAPRWVGSQAVAGRTASSR